MNRNLPIGIFDSGVGGLTVYRALHNCLPNERFIYLGDTARVPYGTKSLSTVERYAIENARFLAARGIKLLIVACNTASALALPAICAAVDVDVIGVIEPGAAAAVRASKSGRIGVIGTEATVKSGAYARAITNLRAESQVFTVACPLFVSLAEEGWAESVVASQVADEYLRSMTSNDIDCLVLGCTHYPILRNVIQNAVGTSVTLIDSGEATAAAVEQNLVDTGLAREATGPLDRHRTLCCDLDHFFVTDAAERFGRVAQRFLGSAPSKLEAVEVWGYDELRTH